jgi:carboxyl-terminal processing protease
MIRKFRPLFAASFVIVGCAFLGGLFGAGAQGRGGPNGGNTGEAELTESNQTFSRVYSAVEENYADPVSADKAIYQGAIPGMLRTLDPHSNFFDPRAYSVTREEQRGRYYGVGMTIQPREGKTIVVEPFLGSPAYKAGIRPGDVISAVDGKSTDNLPSADIADMLKGPKGTQVKITLLREGSEKPLDYIVTRDEIKRYSVEQAFEVAPRIAYIKIAGFSNENTADELAEAIKKLDAKTLKGVIVDLRENPGGLLNEGVAVASTFLHKGQLIVSHRGRNSPPKPYYAGNENKGYDFPLVVMMNRRSASASEIVAGAIQDHDRGLVVGEVSFGKGLVQTVYPLSENAGLALTTAKYYTPSGRLIQRDYSGLSLFDYYYSNQEKANNNTTHEGQEVKTTDSGRLVYGGGGITPDIRLEPQKLNRFETLLEYKYAFFNFAKHYLATHKTVPEDFQTTDPVMNEFRDYLNKEKITFTEGDIQDNRDFLSLRIKSDLIAAIYGRAEGDRVLTNSDPWVKKAIEAIPQAEDLEKKVRRISAQLRMPK